MNMVWPDCWPPLIARAWLIFACASRAIWFASAEGMLCGFAIGGGANWGCCIGGWPYEGGAP